jgi:hypothetical protein
VFMEQFIPKVNKEVFPFLVQSFSPSILVVDRGEWNFVCRGEIRRSTMEHQK